MSLSRKNRQEIIGALLREIGRSQFYEDFSVTEFAESCGLSRQSIYRYLEELEMEGKIKKLPGKYNYRLIDTHYQQKYVIKDLEEGSVWECDISPILQDLPEIAFKSCAYAFCEMLNNAIEHSEGTEVVVGVSINAFSITFQIVDDGIGIFTKIASAMRFREKRYSILELAKGKFTTDPKSHTGEGIFFSSKASDVFGIFSDDLVFSSINYRGDDNERLLNYKHTQSGGTSVVFVVFRDHCVPTSELFDRYTKEPDHYGFTKTIVPVKLLEYGEARPTFVSRSQARRLLARFERFERIELDFSGIEEIGQGFADEIFRVFTSLHLESEITAINCNIQVDKMIKHVSRH